MTLGPHGIRMTRSYWHLTVQLALKDFKIRYTNAVLGYTWSVLQPLLFFLIYYLVFSVFIRFDIPNYPGYLLLGIVLWTFFSEGSANGVGSMLARGNLITKAPLPRHAVVVAAVLNAMLVFVINLGVVAALLIATGTRIQWPALALPILLADLALFTLGISLLLSPLHVRYHDVGYLWGTIVQIGFWLTPIIYHETMVPERWRWLLSYNLLARIITHSREALIYAVWPDWYSVLTITAIACLVLAVGLAAFQRLQVRLVEYY
jgi:ABC-type polysaccharide/polyol phosphate export permease